MTKKTLKIILLVALAGSSAYFRPHSRNLPQPSATQPNNSGFTDPNVIQNAYNNQQSNIQVKQSGRIVKILREDDYGPKHQRFLVQLDSNQKLLIAHNIDLAPKVEDLKVGEMIVFSGEYEWNNKGGVVHWTHHDPKNRHPNGWLLYNNRKYD